MALPTKVVKCPSGLEVEIRAMSGLDLIQDATEDAAATGIDRLCSCAVNPKISREKKDNGAMWLGDMVAGDVAVLTSELNDLSGLGDDRLRPFARTASSRLDSISSEKPTASARATSSGTN